MQAVHVQLTPNRHTCLTAFARAVRPRQALSVSEWADKYRILVSKGSGEPGQFRTSRTPYLREIMDCFSTTSRVRKVSVMASSQSGKTDGVMVNVIGYTMDEMAAPMLVLMPTLEARDKWKIQKLNPLLQSTPQIRDLLGGVKSRDATNTKDSIDFPGATLFLAGGNSKQSYAQVSARIVMADDLDRFPADVGDEGDPVLLLKGRTKSFARWKMLLVSTPTIKGASLIEREWLESDQRRYNVPCPHCDEMQPLVWGGADVAHGIKWNTALTEAVYVCRACFGEIHEHKRSTILQHGRWIPEHPSVEDRGYHITALITSPGLGPSWLDLAREWKSAVKTPTALKVFTNTHLAEVWEEKTEGAESADIMSRREDYPADVKGLLILVRTLGIDVQKDRIEVTEIGFGLEEEAWLIDHAILEGPTSQDAVWDLLEAHIKAVRPTAFAIDAGYETDRVRKFVARYAATYAFAVVGRDGHERPITLTAQQRAQLLRRQRKSGVIIHVIGDHQAKLRIYERLKIETPGPKCIHFPANQPAFDDEYFAQLTAYRLERRIPTHRKGRIKSLKPVLEWVETRARVEALDCFKYALAALYLANIDLAALAKKRQQQPDKPALAGEPRESFLNRRPKGGFATGWKK